eukprot:jgi/Chlat1/5076/Chrsp33S05072
MLSSRRALSWCVLGLFLGFSRASSLRHLLAAAAAEPAFGQVLRMGQAAFSSSPPVAMAAAWMLSLALLAVGASALTVQELYPFGAASGDTTMRTCYACASNLVRLPAAVPVFGVPSVRGVYINSNGGIHFRRSYGGLPREFPAQDPNLSMVAGFWTQLYNLCRNCGQTTYRTINDAAILAGISDDTREAFPAEQLAAGFSATSAVIATWNNTATCCTAKLAAETFQIVIAFNTDTTFIFLLYANDRPQTTNLYYKAQAGFNVGDGVRSYSLPSALTAAAGNATRESSNIGQPGKWCFGLTANQTIGAIAYAGGPYTVAVCSNIQLRAYGGDACGQPRTLAWDFDNDGVFDNAVGGRPTFRAANLRPGVYTISARASSPSTCPGPDDPVVLSTTVTVTGSAVPLIRRVQARTRTANAGSVNNEAYVGELFRPTADIVIASCRPHNLTINCGPDNMSRQKGACQYNTTGDKHITVTLEQDGFVASEEIVVTVKTISLAEPFEMRACDYLQLTAGVGVDACGKQRVLRWDYDNDGEFDDASGPYAVINNDQRLPPGVHTLSIQASSSPSCPASPPEVRSTTLNVTAVPPVISSLRASTLSGSPNATIGESIRISAQTFLQRCLPYTQTISCGPDNVAEAYSGTAVCRYNSTGVKVITVTLEQFGIVVSRSINVTVLPFIIGGPYREQICSSIRLTAVASTDACGQERSLAWDLDNDGLFDDASGRNPSFNAYAQGLGLGVNTISVRASSSCPDSPPEVASTTVNVTTVRPAIGAINTYPESGNPVASVAERIRVGVQSTKAYCVPDNLVLDCGPDSVGNEMETCRYSTSGTKTITTTISQFGVVASRSRNITVTTFYMGGPYRVSPCSYVYLAAPITVDACGRQRVLAWDFDNDGAFDDSTASRPYIFPSKFGLYPGVHPVSVQSSSSPPCPASPTEVYTVNLTVIAGAKIAITRINTSPRSGNPVPTAGEDIQVSVTRSTLYCFPSTVTVDCGADNVSNKTSICRYNSPGLKVITATLTQNNVSVSLSKNITIATYYIGELYRVSLCGSIYVAAAGGDFDSDGDFDDATGPRPRFDAGTLHLRPGVYSLSARASSDPDSSCPGSTPITLTTNVTVIGSTTPPRIYSVRGVPDSGNARPTVGEAVLVSVSYTNTYCLPFDLTIQCGPDHVGNKTGYCQYGTSGVKLITVTLSQDGVEVSRSVNVTVINNAPSCATQAFPEGRVRGKRGCSVYAWSYRFACNYPNNIKQYTKLSEAFASRASEDARLIERLFGNRTIGQSLRTGSRRIDTLAREATAALLNAETVYYAQCPLSVKLDFRHALYSRGNVTQLTTVMRKFNSQNYAQSGCPLTYC